MRIFIRLFILFFYTEVVAQVVSFPHTENFDSVTVPSLPTGWRSTANRSATGDFTTTKSSPLSDSNAVISTNSKINQILTSPILDFSDKEVDSLEFWERRSSSHNSGLLIEASIDGGNTFDILIGDTIKNPGTTSYTQRKFKLPPTLNSQSTVKIRWNVIGNGSGSTGTIRFDDISINALYHTDATVLSIRFHPSFPITGDSVIVTATIKNAGLLPIQNIPVEFYSDTNRNSQPDADELFGSILIGTTLQPNETLQVQSDLRNLPFGEYPIIVRTHLSTDQNLLNDSKMVNFSVGLPPLSVVVNEIMYAPKYPEPEWIEIYNTSPNDVDLKNWKIGNRNSVNKYLISHTSLVLKSREYGIVTKDISQFTAIHPDIPAQIIQVSALPTYLFNNSGDAVVLFDHRGAIIDSVRYFPSWGGTDSTSLERIECQGISNDSTNWGPSGDSTLSSPGRQNYLTPLECDLKIIRISIKNHSITQMDLGVVLKNTGHQPASNFTVELFHDANNDSIPQPFEKLETKNINTPINFKDSLQINFQWNNPPFGRSQIVAVINYAIDMRLKDNIMAATAKNSFPMHSLVINEIMYESKTGDAEYIELLNPGNDSIDIRDWRLSDYYDTSTSSTKHIITKSSYILGAGGYLVVAFDTTIQDRFSYLNDSTFKKIIKQNSISLNNDGDDIILIDLTGNTIDSVHYLPSWHNTDVSDVSGRSLERINPHLGSNDRRNWSTCADPRGGTPDKQNSLYTLVVPTNSSLSFNPNPFSPDGDGHEDVTIINYVLPATTALIRLRIYDVKGRLVRTLANSEPSGSNGQIIWDGYNDKGEKVRIGIYIVLLEALDGLGGDIKTIKQTVVVAAKL